MWGQLDNIKFVIVRVFNWLDPAGKIPWDRSLGYQQIAHIAAALSIGYWVTISVFTNTFHSASRTLIRSQLVRLSWVVNGFV